MNYCINRLLRPYYMATTNRSAGLKAEVKFWDKWLKTKGLHWPDDFKNRLDPNLCLSDYHRRLIDHIPFPEVRILDVGAGPLTALGKKHPTKKVTIVATDVLANEYERLLKKHNIHPIIKTVYGEAEILSQLFPENSFDLVNAQNCIDHAQDPLEAIKQMLYVVRSGCYVALNHKENEANNENYRNLHQWNFTIEDDCFIIKGRKNTINVSMAIETLGQLESSVENKRVKVQIKKL